MSAIGLGTGRLPIGRCRYFPCPREKAWRRSLFECDHISLFSQYQLVSIGENVHLCRISTDNKSSISDSGDRDAGTILRWSSAVRLRVVDSNSVHMFVRGLVESKLLFPAFCFSDLEEEDGCQHRARIVPIEQPCNQTTNFVAVFTRPPIIPLSVVFRKIAISTEPTPTDRLLPLQLSSIKRQISGMCILYRKSVITTLVSISLGDIPCEMIVESVSCQQASNVSSKPVMHLCRLERVLMIDILTG